MYGNLIIWRYNNLDQNTAISIPMLRNSIRKGNRVFPKWCYNNKPREISHPKKIFSIETLLTRD